MVSAGGNQLRQDGIGDRRQLGSTVNLEVKNPLQLGDARFGIIRDEMERLHAGHLCSMAVVEIIVHEDACCGIEAIALAEQLVDGRIRFAQGVAGMTQYQEYIAQGGTLDYNSWISAVHNTMEEAPQDGNFYCRRNGRWVAVAVQALADVTLSGTTGYDEETPVGAPFSIVFDVAASNGADVEFTLTGGTLPAGITLSGRTLSGTPTTEGSAELVFTASTTGATLEISVKLTITAARTMYYGYVMSSTSVYRVTDITADMLEVPTVKSANAAALGKTSLGDAPAGAIVFVMLPKSSLLTAAKFDGISGYVEFEEDAGGITGSGANGTEITLFGATYLAYGEVRLIAGETFIKVEAL